MYRAWVRCCKCETAEDKTQVNFRTVDGTYNIYSKSPYAQVYTVSTPCIILYIIDVPITHFLRKNIYFWRRYNEVKHVWTNRWIFKTIYNLRYS